MMKIDNLILRGLFSNYLSNPSVNHRYTHTNTHTHIIFPLNNIWNEKWNEMKIKHETYDKSTDIILTKFC